MWHYSCDECLRSLSPSRRRSATLSLRALSPEPWPQRMDLVRRLRLRAGDLMGVFGKTTLARRGPKAISRKSETSLAIPRCLGLINTARCISLRLPLRVPVHPFSNRAAACQRIACFVHHARQACMHTVSWHFMCSTCLSSIAIPK